jgi:hypothetical protein
MKTEDIIKCLQLRCEATRFNDYLLVNALSRLRTLQSADKKTNELLEILESVMDEWRCGNEPNINDCGVYEKALNIIAKAKEEK